MTRLICSYLFQPANLSIDFERFVDSSDSECNDEEEPFLLKSKYPKVPKFSDTRKLCCNLPKKQRKIPNLLVFRHKDSNGIANSEDPDQTSPVGAV